MNISKRIIPLPLIAAVYKDNEWRSSVQPLLKKYFSIIFQHYKVFHKFSHTIDIAFVDKWFIWWLSLQNTKFFLISYTHFQKISLRSLIHDLSHSLQSNQRSSSKFAQVLIVVSALLISVLLDEDYENNIFLVKLWLFREIFSFSHLYLAKIY